MAFDVTFRILQSHKSTSVPVPCRCPIVDGYVHDARPTMWAPIISMKKIGTDPFDIFPIDFDGWNTSSDISGYRKLIQTLGLKTTTFDIVVSMPNTGPFPEEVLIDEFATDAGQMNNVEVNAYTIDFKMTAKHNNTSDSARLKYVVYHRDTGGTETQLFSAFSPYLTTTMASYDVSTTLNRAWGTNERLVVKYYARNESVA